MNLERINQILAKECPELMRVSPSYRYYYHDKVGHRYFWTTEKVMHKGKLSWVSGIYRYKKGKKIWTATKLAKSSTRTKAKERAYQLYLKEKKGE